MTAVINNIKIYDDEWLLDRIFCATNIAKVNNSVLEPQISNLNRKTHFVNFAKFCESINRNEQSVKKFIENDLRSDSSITGSKELIIGKVFKKELIMQTIVNYIEKYVQCKNCKSVSTNEVAEGRFTYLVCDGCKAKNTI